MLRLNRRAQSILEYAILIFVVVAALIVMQYYVKRGIQGRMRSTTDEIGEQYSPGHTESNYTTTRNTSTIERVNIDQDQKKVPGVTTRKFEKDLTTRTGNETVDAYRVGGTDGEDWPE